LKPDLVNSLRCTNCDESNFSLIVQEQNKVEVRQGTLTCNHCKTSYPIQNGIVNFLVNPRQEIVSEQKGWVTLSKEKGYYEFDLTHQVTLRLPDLTGFDEKYQEQWLPNITNFHQALKKLKLKGNEKILDLGAGRCWATKTLAKPGCKVVAFDILDDPIMGIGAADSLFADNPYFERALGDMEKLPFKTGNFDVVFSTASIHHSNIHKSIAESARVLKPGGRLVLINEPTVEASDERLAKMVGDEVDAGIAEHVYTIDEYCATAEKAGITPTLHCPHGMKSNIKKAVKNPRESLRHRNLKRAIHWMLKAHIINDRSLSLVWRISKKNRYRFGLFLIGIKEDYPRR
jgi:ubiquinone/menaquinone biosynthesis C-methylase UbiE/uncharacterized protein YbaR (Trm112 family)